jgi:hypothetical protein
MTNDACTNEEWTNIDRSIRTRHFQQRDLHIYFLTYHDDCLDCWTLDDGKVLMDRYTQEEERDGMVLCCTLDFGQHVGGDRRREK